MALSEASEEEMGHFPCQHLQTPSVHINEIYIYIYMNIYIYIYICICMHIYVDGFPNGWVPLIRIMVYWGLR